MPSSPEILAGPGVHSGAPGRLELRRREVGAAGSPDLAGPRIHLPGAAAPLAPRDLARLPRRARRATVLCEGSSGLATPEHLLASLLFFADCPLDVHVTGPEVPILDGSALPFREALARLFPERARRPAWREYPADLTWEDSWDGGHVRVRPAPRFRATYRLDRMSPSWAASLVAPEEAWEGVLPARTFISAGEWRRLSDGGQGLLRGATMDAGLLLADSPEEHAELLAGPLGRGGPCPLVNQPAWRLPDEPARHKLLDLLGDLALLGLALPALAIDIRNGGHAAHLRLVDRLAALGTAPA